MNRLATMPPDAQERVRRIADPGLREQCVDLYFAMVERENSPAARRAAQEDQRTREAEELHALHAFANKCVSGQYGSPAAKYAAAFFGAQPRTLYTLREFKGNALALIGGKR